MQRENSLEKSIMLGMASFSARFLTADVNDGMTTATMVCHAAEAPVPQERPCQETSGQMH